MTGFPSFHRPQHRHVVQSPRQPRQQAVRDLHRTALYRPQIKIGRSPAAFLEIERVDLACASVQKQENAIFSRTPQLGFRCGAYVLRAYHRREVITREPDRADSQKTATRKARNSGWDHRNTHRLNRNSVLFSRLHSRSSAPVSRYCSICAAAIRFSRSVGNRLSAARNSSSAIASFFRSGSALRSFFSRPPSALTRCLIKGLLSSVEACAIELARLFSP